MRQRRVAQPTTDTNSKWRIVSMDQPVDFSRPFVVFSNDFTEAQIMAVLLVLDTNQEQAFTGDLCKQCGGMLIQTGTCKTCTQCGFNEGCG